MKITFTETRHQTFSMVQPGTFTASDAAIPVGPLPVPHMVFDPFDVVGGPRVNAGGIRVAARRTPTGHSPHHGGVPDLCFKSMFFLSVTVTIKVFSDFSKILETRYDESNFHVQAYLVEAVQAAAGVPLAGPFGGVLRQNANMDVGGKMAPPS